MITRLDIFDFDGTLFKSPEKPVNWKGGWWGKRHSLLPPFVPAQISESLFNAKVLGEFRASRMRDGTHTVMMTGRHWGLRNEVMNILAACDLCTKEDHHTLLEESNRFIFISGGNTLQGKMDRIKELLEEFPEVKTIEMWEDRVEHITEFRKYFNILKSRFPLLENCTVHEPPDWE